jgi:hypothetical protein
MSPWKRALTAPVGAGHEEAQLSLAQGSVRATINTALSGSWIIEAAAGLHRMRGREPRSQMFFNGLSPACRHCVLAPVEAGFACKAPVGAGL